MHGREFSYFRRVPYSDFRGEQPDIFLTIRYRGSSRDGWRLADFSIQNRPDEKLRAKKIVLVTPSSGIRIAPAIAEQADVWRMDRERIGRTISLDQTLSPSNDEHAGQSVHFYVRHPRDVVDFGRHTINVSILIEDKTDPKKQWWTTIEGKIPQEPGDPVTFSERSPRVPE
jgi:hypothetical protein